MRTLHWSSTSLGYMKPSTPGIIELPHRHIQVLVLDLGIGGHVGLEDLNLVVLHKVVNGVLGILEIDQLTGAGGAVLAAGGSESLSDAVVTESAFIYRLFFRV